jgi:hypothetical protein
LSAGSDFTSKLLTEGEAKAVATTQAVRGAHLVQRCWALAPSCCRVRCICGHVIGQVFEEFLEYGRAERRCVCFLVLDVDSMLGVKDVTEVSSCWIGVS